MISEFNPTLASGIRSNHKKVTVSYQSNRKRPNSLMLI